MALIGSSMTHNPFELTGFKYLTDKLNLFANGFEPTESNQSSANIDNVMRDPFEQPSLDELLDPGFFVKMPYSSKMRVEVKINSVTQGGLRGPDFEEP